MANVGPHNFLLDDLSDVAPNLVSWLAKVANDGGSPAPTVATGASSGTGAAAATVGAGANSRRGTITLNAGATGLAAGVMAVVTFGAALSAAPRNVTIDPASANVSVLSPYSPSSSWTATGFNIAFGATGSSGVTGYIVGYTVET